MPRKKAVVDAIGTAVAAASVVKKNPNLESAALLSWLAVPDNRNIITGAAGVRASRLAIVLIALQVLLRIRGACRQTSLLFPKRADSVCLPNIFQRLSAIRSTKNKHITNLLTLSASFTQRKLGSAHLVLELLMKTEHVVCRAIFFC